MLTRIMKWITMAVLLTAAMLWRSAVNSQFPQLLLVLLSIVLFAASLAALRTQPLLSIPSITDRTPGSESL